VSARTIVDSRVLPREFVLDRTNPELFALCTDYLKLAKLTYGVFDLFRRDGEDRWTFLECNPEGQFGCAMGLNFEDVVGHMGGIIRRKFEISRLCEAI